jgi:hypothetical protein
MIQTPAEIVSPAFFLRTAVERKLFLIIATSLGRSPYREQPAIDESVMLAIVGNDLATSRRGATQPDLICPRGFGQS